jgi:hypothetical protein
MNVTPILYNPIYETEELEYLEISDGDVIYRKRPEGGRYYVDFSDDGGDTWELGIVNILIDENVIIRTIDNEPSGYRQRVSGRNYYIDQELTPTGFAGSEGTDWETIYMIIQ